MPARHYGSTAHEIARPEGIAWGNTPVQGKKAVNMWQTMIGIRAFEETVLELFAQNRISGTTHASIGAEATAVALMRNVQPDDAVFSNHRCHGHYLAYGGPPEMLLAELMSDRAGLCQGRGGSQHMHYRNFYTNGIQGGIVRNAVGYALANKLDSRGANVIVMLGDGTLGQGVVYESFNIAAIYDVPILFVVEDNQYAMSTRCEDAFAGDMATRIQAFGIRTFEFTGTDAEKLCAFFEEVFTCLNASRKPVCAVVHNYRLCAHSKGDDTRDPSEIAQHQREDPLLLARARMGNAAFEECHQQARQRFRLMAEHIASQLTYLPDTDVPGSKPVPLLPEKILPNGRERGVESLQRAFMHALEDHRVVFLGEDIRDPYGGAFKATKGLSAAYGGRVLNMPISEPAITGVGVGLALAGKLPVVEIMFGDFVSLAFDQILNHAVKYAWIYGGEVCVPLVIRSPMGGRRGYGPTHSQSLEKFLVGIPRLQVLALSPVHDAQAIYEHLLQTVDGPTVVIENKSLYAQRPAAVAHGKYGNFFVDAVANATYPSLRLSLDPASQPHYVCVTYGGMTAFCLAAAEQLMIEDEIQVDVLVLCQLAPFPLADVRAVLQGDSSLIVVEEGTKSHGIGAEIVAQCVENGLGRHFLRIAAPDSPIPNGARLEETLLPDSDTIMSAVRKHFYGN